MGLLHQIEGHKAKVEKNPFARSSQLPQVATLRDGVKGLVLAYKKR